MLTTLQLVILLAAYGPVDFTDVVRNHVSNNSLTIDASNGVFGDPWYGTQKSLVIIYQYGDSKPIVATAPEGSKITIVPAEENHQPWNPPSVGELSILGAAYGLADVTTKVTSQIQQNRLSFTSNNPTLADGWFGVYKTFVMAYQYYPGRIMTVIGKENENIFVSFAPELRIFKAAYGLKDVTDIVKSIVQKQGSTRLDVQVENNVFGDSWYGTQKSLVVVYQYGDGVPQVAFQREHGQMAIAFSPKLQVLEATYGLKDVTEILNQLVQKQGGMGLDLHVNYKFFNDQDIGSKRSLMVFYQYEDSAPQASMECDDQLLSIRYADPTKYSPMSEYTKLEVMGAVYGLEDVTKKVQGKVTDNQLILSPHNQVFGDSWYGVQKTLVIVYRCGQGAPGLVIQKEVYDVNLNSVNITCSQ